MSFVLPAGIGFKKLLHSYLKFLLSLKISHTFIAFIGEINLRLYEHLMNLI